MPHGSRNTTGQPQADEQHLLDCALSRWQGAPDRCRWCNSRLGPRRQRWCSETCMWEWRREHVWAYAQPAALERDHRTCRNCSSTRTLQVHHDPPCRGRRAQGCQHHQHNLVTLCTPCHRAAHGVLAPELAQLSRREQHAWLEQRGWTRLASSWRHPDPDDRGSYTLNAALKKANA